MSNIDYESTVLIEINVIEAKYYPPPPSPDNACQSFHTLKTELTSNQIKLKF